MIRRGIVVVHGVGQQHQGEQLDLVLEPLVAFLRGALGPAHVALEMTERNPVGVPAGAVIYLRRDGEPAPFEEWHVREAWWAASFQPSDGDQVLGWAVMAFGLHTRVLWDLIETNLLRAFRPGHNRHGDGVWRIPAIYDGAASGPRRVVLVSVEVLNAILIWLGDLFVHAVGLLLIVPFYLFLRFPLLRLDASLAGQVHRAFVNFFATGIGDQYAMTHRSGAISAASGIVVDAIEPLLAPGGLECRTVTVVAHSGGCVVSFDALGSGRVAAWLAAPPAEPATRRRLTWVTVGSGLNLAWRMHNPNSDQQRVFFRERPLHRAINWIDVYSRYDPVPQGEAPKALSRALLATAEARESERFVSLRVANDDWPFSDHGAYWANREEVIARLVHAITDDGPALGQSPQDWLAGNSSDHVLAPAIDASIAQAPRRRRRVAGRRLPIAAFAGVGVLLAVPTVFLAVSPSLLDAFSTAPGFAGLYGIISAVGRWLVADGELWIAEWDITCFADTRLWLGGTIPWQALWIDLTHHRGWLVGLAAVATVAVLIPPAVDLVRSLRQWRQPVRFGW